MKSFLGALALLPLMAAAHVENGVWIGKTDSGDQCEMTAVKTYFDGVLKHPLTERIDLIVNGLNFTVQHPPVIDEAKPEAFFDHDQFKGIIPTTMGATALVLKMTHTKTYEGPAEYYLINHDYKAAISSVIKCAGLIKK